jgi:arylsulfatase A-like enzyme
MPVLYVDVDSLRPDHLGAYGYTAGTSPNIDALAADAVVFERAYVANSPCLPSRAALLTGRYGLANGVETHGPPAQTLRHPVHDVDWAGTWSDHVPGRPWWSLPRLFYEERVRTSAVSSFPRHPAPWFHDTWHEVRQPQEPAGDARAPQDSGGGESFQTPRAEAVVDEAVEVLERNADGEFFLYVQLWDPHAPYNRSAAEVEEFASVPVPPYPTAEQLADHREWDAWRSADQMGIEDRDDLRRLLANYDAEVRYADRHVGRLLDALREAGLYEETLVVLTADHGEEFGEHGAYREHWSTHDGTQRVPLLVKPPAATQYRPGRRSQLVTNVDLPPTLADYAGLDRPARWQGTSVRPVLESPDADWRDAVVVDHGLYTAQRAVRTDRWKLVETLHPGMWDGVLPETQLYDMESDPWEQSDLAADRPAVVDRLAAVRADWVEDHAAGDRDALREVADRGPSGYNAFREEFAGV